MLDVAAGEAMPAGSTYRVTLETELLASEKVSVSLFGEDLPQLTAAREGD